MQVRSTKPIARSIVPIGDGVEKDTDIGAALNWLAACSGDAAAFFARLSAVQRRYREVVAEDAVRGRDPSWAIIGSDIVASYLAQGKSLLDDRRSYDLALVSHVAPWLKQLGADLPDLKRVVGAQDRALRMLRNVQVHPDTAMFELVMASNYAAEGFEVTFIEEGPGKTHDLRVSLGKSGPELFVELKRLQRGLYEIEERRRHREIFLSLDTFLQEKELSVDIDVTYECELQEVNVEYLHQRLHRALACPILLPEDKRGRMSLVVASSALQTWTPCIATRATATSSSGQSWRGCSQTASFRRTTITSPQGPKNIQRIRDTSIGCSLDPL